MHATNYVCNWGSQKNGMLNMRLIAGMPAGLLNLQLYNMIPKWVCFLNRYKCSISVFQLQLPFNIVEGVAGFCGIACIL